MQVVARGSAVQLSFALYLPTLQQLADPDEYPAGPRLTITDAGAVEKYANVVGRRLGTGTFVFALTIDTDADVLPGGTYTATLTQATVGGQPLVDVDGNAPSVQFSVLDTAATLVEPDRFYSGPMELSTDWGLNPVATEIEVRAAQTQLDNWMHRSLWPTVYEPAPFRLRGSNVFQVPYTPVIQVLSCEGAYVPGRQHTRWKQPAQDIALLGAAGWQPVPISNLQIQEATGQIYITSSLQNASFTQVRVRLLAGYPVIDRAAKLAVAQTIAWMRFKGFSDLVRYATGQVSRELGDSLIPGSAKSACERWRIKSIR